MIYFFARQLKRETERESDLIVGLTLQGAKMAKAGEAEGRRFFGVSHTGGGVHTLRPSAATFPRQSGEAESEVELTGRKLVPTWDAATAGMALLAMTQHPPLFLIFLIISYLLLLCS